MTTNRDYEQAAPAQFNLGRAYEKGWGVPYDYIQAYKWFNLAASQSHSGRDMAERARDEISKEMTPAQISQAQKLSREWKRLPDR